MAKRRKKVYEFKPDRQETGILKQLYLTRLQRRQILKWSVLGALCILMLTIQDVMMSQFRFSGATTDLAVAAIFLIGLYEGTENGSLFALIACPVVVLNLVRQSLWRRSGGSILLCTCVGIVFYEMMNFLFGMFQGITIWDRAGVFALVAGFTCAAAFPLYPIVKQISKIGGETWKE